MTVKTLYPDDTDKEKEKRFIFSPSNVCWKQSCVSNIKNIVSEFRHHRPKKENKNVTFIFMTDTMLIISYSTFLSNDILLEF